MKKTVFILFTLLMLTQPSWAARCLDESGSQELSAIIASHKPASLSLIGGFVLRPAQADFLVQNFSYDKGVDIEILRLQLLANGESSTLPLALIFAGHSDKGRDLYLIGCQGSGVRDLLKTPLFRWHENSGGFSTINDLTVYQDNQQSKYPLIRLTQTSIPEKVKKSFFSSSSPSRPGPPIDFIFEYDVKTKQYVAE